MGKMNKFEVLTPSKSKKIGQAITSAIMQVHHDGQIYWEQQLELVINKKPRLCPAFVWSMLLGLVVRQKVRDGEVPRPVHIVTEVQSR